jgi:hypothetical protein
MRCANQGSNKKKNLRITVNSRVGCEDGVPVEMDDIVRLGHPFWGGTKWPYSLPLFTMYANKARGGIAKYQI